MKYFSLFSLVLILASSCGNRGELHVSRFYSLKGTSSEAAVLNNYDTLSCGFRNDTNFVGQVNYKMDSLEPIISLSFHVSETDSSGKFIRDIPSDSVFYDCISCGDESGARTDKKIAVENETILFRVTHQRDSLLRHMNEPGNENAFIFAFHHADSMPSFLHLVVSLETRKQEKNVYYSQEFDFEKNYMEYRGSGGMGKLFCKINCNNPSPGELKLLTRIKKA